MILLPSMCRRLWSCWTSTFRLRSPATTARVRRLSLIDFIFRTGPGTWRWRSSPAASSPTPTTSLPASLSPCSTAISSARRRGCSSTYRAMTTTVASGPRCGAISNVSGSRSEPARPSLGWMRVRTCRGSAWHPGPRSNAALVLATDPATTRRLAAGLRYAGCAVA